MTLPSSHSRRQRERPVRAYFLAERRGFAPGHELDDWLAAEKQVDLVLTSGHAATAGRGREA